MKATLQSIDYAIGIIDGIEKGTSDTPFMDMARVVSILENKEIDEILYQMPTIAEILTVYSTDITILAEWFKPNNEIITSFDMHGIKYDVCPAELLTPNRADLVMQIELDAKNDENKNNFQHIANSIACYAYSSDEVNMKLETPMLDNELYVKNTKENFLKAYKDRAKLFYEKLELSTAMGIRNFFFQITKS